MEHDIIAALSFLLNDSQTACRENTHLAFKHLAQLPSGRLPAGALQPLGLPPRSGTNRAAGHSLEHIFNKVTLELRYNIHIKKAPIMHGHLIKLH